VKKLEKESTVTYTKLPQINLKTSYQKIDKPKIKKKAHVKCIECSTYKYPNKKSNQSKNSRRQISLSQRRCFGCKEKDHNIVVCPKEEASK
jgi:Pyruvate/2-oxoacid:ferredoxin oxidoreductase delta subunit